MRTGSFALCLSVVAAFGVAAPPARGQDPATVLPPAGTVIEKTNAARFAAALSPALSWVVDHGARLKVRQTEAASPSKAMAQATARYAGQVGIDSSLRLANYVAGLPFTTLDAQDPMLGAKLAYNAEVAGSFDDLEIRNIECDARTIGASKESSRPDKHFLLDHFLRLYYTGRLHVDPKPRLEPNPDAVRYREAIFPVIEPFDLKGIGLVTYRYSDRSPSSDTWLYTPQLRRVRRLADAQRSQSLFGQDIDPDSFGGFSGSVAFFAWRTLGETTLLSQFHGATVPVRWGPAPSSFLADVEWEPRKVWVIEARSPDTDSSAPNAIRYEYSRRVLYVDRETWRILASDLYDQQGELWKTWIGSFTAALDGGSFQPSATMLDVKGGFATFCSMPGVSFGSGNLSIDTGNSQASNPDVYSLVWGISPSR